MLLSFPCFSLLGTIVSCCHVIFLFIAICYCYCSSSLCNIDVPFLAMHCSSTPFVVVCCYYCFSSQCVNVVFHHCALLLFPSFMCVAIVVLHQHGLLLLLFCHHVLLLLLIMCYCSPYSYFYWYVSLPFPKYLLNLLLLLNSSLLCYYCSLLSSLWFGSFNLVLPITFAFVQMREKKHEASSFIFFKVSFHIFLLFINFSFCMYVCMCFMNIYVFGFFLVYVFCMLIILGLLFVYKV